MARGSLKRTDPAARPSPLVRDAVERFGLAPQRFLDLACGFGRNTHYLAGLGAFGVAIDSDPIRTHKLRTSLAIGSSHTVVETADEQAFLNKCDTKFDLVCCTDYWRPRLLRDLCRVTAAGGWLILNSPAARGGNWNTLPEGNVVLRELTEACVEIFELRLANAGKESPARTAVSLVARSFSA